MCASHATRYESSYRRGLAGRDSTSSIETSSLGYRYRNTTHTAALRSVGGTTGPGEHIGASKQLGSPGTRRPEQIEVHVRRPRTPSHSRSGSPLVLEPIVLSETDAEAQAHGSAALSVVRGVHTQSSRVSSAARGCRLPSRPGHRTIPSHATLTSRPTIELSRTKRSRATAARTMSCSSREAPPPETLLTLH